MGDGYRLDLIGPFRLCDPLGVVIPVPGRKARALLALLALSPKGERSRVWLQQMLWSECEEEHAQGSLRQELSKLRKWLGSHASAILEVESTQLRLLREHIVIDALSGEKGAQDSELLEGIDLKDEEPFEDWLRERRSALVPVMVAPPPAPPRDSEIRADDRLCVGLLPAQFADGDAECGFAAEDLLGRIAVSLLESGCVRVLDYRTPDAQPTGDLRSRTGPDALLALRILRLSRHCEVSVAVRRLNTSQILFARSATISWDAVDDIDEYVMERSVFVIETVDRLLYALAYGNEWRHEPRHLAARHVMTAIEQMFSLSLSDVHAAGRNLEAACSIAPQSSFYAWRAYRSVFQIDEPGAFDYKLLREEAEEYSQIALELDPYNGLSLSLLTHVSSFVMKNLGRATDFLEKAKSLNTDHVMTHDADALLSFYTGNLKQARVAAARAELLGRYLPFRYCFATTQCMIEALSGNFLAAVQHGERALALEPRSAKKHYPPTLRYLAASYSAARELQAAERTFRSLKAIDPNVSSRNLSPKNYPAPAQHAADFIRKGLMAVAM